MSFRNPEVVKGADSSIVQNIASAVIIPGDTHEDLWGHPNLVTIPGNPVQIEVALRSTDRRGGDRQTAFNHFRTDDDFQSLQPIEKPTAPDWERIGLTSEDFDVAHNGGPGLPDGEWHWARNSVPLASRTILHSRRRGVGTTVKPIPMHTTMTKLLSHSDGLLLVYTRIREDNRDVFRSRAPLRCADVDPGTLSLRRSTERILIPNNGLPVGNFWV